MYVRMHVSTACVWNDLILCVHTVISMTYSPPGPSYRYSSREKTVLLVSNLDQDVSYTLNLSCICMYVCIGTLCMYVLYHVE